MDHSINGHESGANEIIEEAWYAGTDALKEGEGLCYNIDYGTAEDRNGRRGNHVERPSLTNNLAFAGVVASDHSAQAGGQMVRIFVPGSKGVNVALGIDTVIGTGHLTFTAGAGGSHRGRFVKSGFPGRGTVVPRQTVDAIYEADWPGATWSMAIDGITLTVADASLFTAGDTVVILASDKDLIAGVKYLTPGKYTVSTADETTTVVLTASAAAGTLTAAVGVTGYAYTGNPKCQADLLTGEESGGAEFVQCPTAGTDVDLALMSGGVTYVCGTVTLAEDCEHNLDDGAFYGQLKGFWCLGTYEAHDLNIDDLDNGFKMAGTALVELEDIDAIGDFAFLQWFGSWMSINTNVTESS